MGPITYRDLVRMGEAYAQILSEEERSARDELDRELEDHRLCEPSFWNEALDDIKRKCRMKASPVRVLSTEMGPVKACAAFAFFPSFPMRSNLRARCPEDCPSFVSKGRQARLCCVPLSADADTPFRCPPCDQAALQLSELGKGGHTRISRFKSRATIQPPTDEVNFQPCHSQGAKPIVVEAAPMKPHPRIEP